MAASGDTACPHHMGGGEWSTGIQGEEARAAVEHPTMHGAAPRAKNYPAPNVDRAEAEKPCTGLKPLTEEGNGVELS